MINIKKLDLCNCNINRVESFNSMNGIDRGTRIHIKGNVGVEHQREGDQCRPQGKQEKSN